MQVRIQDFKLGWAHLKKNAPSGGRREHFWGISCEKSRFHAKNSYFFQFRGRRENCWGISCEKSRFYAKKSYFFQFRGRRENCWGISCEKSRFYAKKSYFFQFRRGGGEEFWAEIQVVIRQKSVFWIL